MVFTIYKDYKYIHLVKIAFFLYFKSSNDDI